MLPHQAPHPRRLSLATPGSLQYVVVMKIAWAPSLFILLLSAGCATRDTLGDPALPASERATIEGYSRYEFLYFEDLQIVSVDGRREGARAGWPYASSASVPAGTHRIRLVIMRNSRDIALCGFEWTFEAGHRYKLQRLRHDQFLLAHPAVPRFPASVEMVVTGPSGSPRSESALAECGPR